MGLGPGLEAILFFFFFFQVVVVVYALKDFGRCERTQKPLDSHEICWLEEEEE